MTPHFSSLLSFLVAVTFVQPAFAADADQPVRVTTFTVSHPDVDDQAMVAIVRALNEGLRRNTRLEMRDLDTRLADFAQEIPQSTIDEGRQLLADGQKALIGLTEVPAAIKKLGQAVDIFTRVLPFIKKQELADAMMALGIAQLESSDVKAARATFLRLLTWRPDLKYDLERYPPKGVPPFEEARKEVEHSRRGSLEIRSEPAAAQAYVDGRYVGVTPTYAEGLPVGEHYVTLRRDGYRKTVTRAMVSDKAQQVVSTTLDRSSKFILVEQSLATLDKDVGQLKLPGAADNLREVLFIDHGVFLRAARNSATELNLDAFIYDMRTRKRLKNVSRTVLIGPDAPPIEKQVGPLATTLYTNVSYNADLEVPKDAPVPKSNRRPPFYKTWWFWTIAGVATTGIVLTAVFARPPESCGSNFCPVFTP